MVIHLEVHKKQVGGDGYVINVNESIGGMPAYARYSNNYRPIFDGELLQNGGGNCGCNIESNKKDPLIFDLIKQQGGSKKKKNISQFEVIKEVSYILTPLAVESLVLLIVNIFIDFYSEKKPLKAKQLGGNISQLEGILAPLGKNNLLVLSGLLLLHYFAIENNRNTEKKGGYKLKKTFSKILKEGGMKSTLLRKIEEAFELKINKNNDESNGRNIKKGGNPLKDLIAPLGTSAFIATGLLVLLQKVFVQNIEKKEKKVGGSNKIKDNTKNNIQNNTQNKNYEKLFHLIAPITFNTFAKKSFLEKYT
jgi:hypothetical protein